MLQITNSRSICSPPLPVPMEAFTRTYRLAKLRTIITIRDKSLINRRVSTSMLLLTRMLVLRLRQRSKTCKLSWSRWNLTKTYSRSQWSTLRRNWTARATSLGARTMNLGRWESQSWSYKGRTPSSGHRIWHQRRPRPWMLHSLSSWTIQSLTRQEWFTLQLGKLLHTLRVRLSTQDSMSCSSRSSLQAAPVHRSHRVAVE